METSRPGWLRRNAGVISIPVLVFAIILIIITSLMNSFTVTYFSSESYAWAPNKTVVLLLHDHLRRSLIAGFYGSHSHLNDDEKKEEIKSKEPYLPGPPFDDVITVYQGKIIDGELKLQDGSPDKLRLAALRDKIGNKKRGQVEISDSSGVISAGLEPSEDFVKVMVRNWDRQAFYKILPQVVDNTIRGSCFEKYFDPTQPYHDPRAPEDQLVKATGLTLQLFANESEIYNIGVPPVGGSMEYLNDELLPQFPEVRVIVNSLLNNEEVFKKVGKRISKLQGLAFILLVGGIVLLFFRKTE